MSLDGEDRVGDLGEGLEVDVGTAVDLAHGSAGGPAVYDEDFVGGSLGEKGSGKRQKQSGIKNESERGMLADHSTPRFLSWSFIVHRRAILRHVGYTFGCPQFF